MKNFDDIKDLWQQQQVTVHKPAAEAVAQAKKDKQSVGRRMLIQSICLLATIVCLLYIAYSISFEKMTTYIGIGLMVLCLVVFGCIKLYQYYTLRAIDLTGSPSQTVRQLELFYKEQRWINTYGTAIYMVVLNIAFVFYFIEVIAPFSTIWQWIIIGIYTAWMLIATFVLGRRSMRKEHAKMKSIIDRIKQMEQALQE